MNHKYIKTDVEGLVKDPISGAILNVDNERLKAYKKQKQHFANNSETSEKIKKVENDIQEIKKLLEQLIRDRN